MSTTVPQNIKGQNIMGRHKPTRHSLRHSRMIVTSKHFQGENSRLERCEQKILSGNFLLSRFELILIVNSVFIFERIKHSLCLAGAICSHPEDRRRRESCDAGRMDLFICELDANSTESVLERIDHHCFGSTRSLLIDL